MLHPIELTPLKHVTNTNDVGDEVPINCMTIAYSRAPNFGNLFSIQKIQKPTGPNVLSFIG